MEARRETTRSQNYQKKMYKQAKELQKKHDLEDAKNHAADNVLNKYVQGSTEIDKLS